MLRPSNSATSLGSMDSKGDASTGSEGLYDWTAPRFGGLSVASEPKPELTLADGARFPEFRPDDGSPSDGGVASSWTPASTIVRPSLSIAEPAAEPTTEEVAETCLGRSSALPSGRTPRARKRP